MEQQDLVGVSRSEDWGLVLFPDGRGAWDFYNVGFAGRQAFEWDFNKETGILKIWGTANGMERDGSDIVTLEWRDGRRVLRLSAAEANESLDEVYYWDMPIEEYRVPTESWKTEDEVPKFAGNELKDSKEFLVFMEWFCAYPTSFFWKRDNRFYRLEAFLRGLEWGKGLTSEGRGEWIVELKKFEKWMNIKLVDMQRTPQEWSNALLKQANGDQSKAFELFVENWKTYLEESGRPPTEVGE